MSIIFPALLAGLILGSLFSIPAYLFGHSAGMRFWQEKARETIRRKHEEALHGNR